MITRFQSAKKMDDSVAELKTLIETIKTDLGNKIDNLVKKLDDKDKTIEDLQAKVTLLEGKVAYNEKRYELLERRMDDSEQYSRRTSLRINGIPYHGKESAEESLRKVKVEVVKLGIDIKDDDYDRAHRVGFTKDIQGNPVKNCQMIVKFTSFRSRTDVYRNRKKGTEGGKVRFYVDQTKRRFDLRKMAVEYVKDKPDVDFAFVDINCSLCLRLKNGQFRFFNSEEELINLVG